MKRNTNFARRKDEIISSRFTAIFANCDKRLCPIKCRRREKYRWCYLNSRGISTRFWNFCNCDFALRCVIWFLSGVFNRFAPRIAILYEILKRDMTLIKFALKLAIRILLRDKRILIIITRRTKLIYCKHNFKNLFSQSEIFLHFETTLLFW